MIYTITDEQLGDIVELAIRNGRNWARTGYLTEKPVDCFNRTYEAAKDILNSRIAKQIEFEFGYECGFRNVHPNGQQCDCDHE